MLYCHGNGGNVAYWADAGKVLHDRVGVSVLLFDYRGYGRSEGEPCEAGVLADARAARTWLARREGIAEQPIVLDGPLAWRSRCGRFGRCRRCAGPGARKHVHLDSRRGADHVSAAAGSRFLMQTQFNSLRKIADYHGPLLQSHGTADRLIPYAIGRRLFDAANQPKQFVPIPGGDHNDPQNDEYYGHLSAFLDRLK